MLGPFLSTEYAFIFLTVRLFVSLPHISHPPLSYTYLSVGIVRVVCNPPKSRHLHNFGLNFNWLRPGTIICVYTQADYPGSCGDVGGVG